MWFIGWIELKCVLVLLVYFGSSVRLEVMKDCVYFEWFMYENGFVGLVRLNMFCSVCMNEKWL